MCRHKPFLKKPEDDKTRIYTKIENDPWYTGRCEECGKRTNSKSGFKGPKGLTCSDCANKEKNNFKKELSHKIFSLF